MTYWQFSPPLGDVITGNQSSSPREQVIKSTQPARVRCPESQRGAMASTMLLLLVAVAQTLIEIRAAPRPAPLPGVRAARGGDTGQCCPARGSTAGAGRDAWEATHRTAPTRAAGGCALAAGAQSEAEPVGG